MGKKSISTLATVFLIFLFCNSLFAKEVKHIRVIWDKHPAHEASIAWTTLGFFKDKNNFLYLDTTPHGGKIEDYPNKLEIETKSVFPYGFDNVHYIKLKDLLPSTKYYFTIQSDTNISKEYYFLTAPVDDRKLEFIVGGDSRTDVAMRQNINRQLAAMFIKYPDILALVHGGDYIHHGRSWKEYKQWLKDYQLTYGADGKILPIIPTRGNHEKSRSLYNKVFVKPGGKGVNNYFVSLFPDFALITLNTNINHAGKQKKWLARKLKVLSKQVKWIIPNYHRPAYPGVKKAGKALKHWVPLFEAYQVDMVFESDGHVLKRTVPIYRGARDDAKGIIYLGEGGFGVKLREAANKHKWFFKSPGYAVSEYHILRLTIESDKIITTIHLETGAVYDKIVLTPRQR